MLAPLLDCHCHLDRYADPKGMALEGLSHNVFMVAMTHLPSHFKAGIAHVRGLKGLRLAVGLHPLAAAEHVRERRMFDECVAMSSFVGEVGLDFSPHGIATRPVQLETFRFVAQHVSSTPKVVSIHSRGAETAVLDTLLEYRVRHAMFHWYSGPTGILDEAVRAGHYFSVNPAMVKSAKGKRLIERIPPGQLLTETDGPYVTLDKRPAKPWDVLEVSRYLAQLWSMPVPEVQEKVWQNFRRMLAQLRLMELG